MSLAPPESPGEALVQLAGELRRGDPLVAERVVDPVDVPTLGLLAAAGPRTAANAAAYALVVEAVREGYLLHHSAPRIVRGADPDLALLAGDHLYALGIELLAALSDLEAVAELADLISAAAQLHGEGRGQLADALWLAATTAIAAGASAAHEAAKVALREDAPGAEAMLRDAAREAARAGGFEEALGEAFEAIGFGAQSG